MDNVSVWTLARLGKRILRNNSSSVSLRLNESERGRFRARDSHCCAPTHTSVAVLPGSLIDSLAQSAGGPPAIPRQSLETAMNTRGAEFEDARAAFGSECRNIRAMSSLGRSLIPVVENVDYGSVSVEVIESEETQRTNESPQ